MSRSPFRPRSSIHMSPISIPLKMQLILNTRSQHSSSGIDSYYAQILSVLAQIFSQSKDLTSSYLTIRSLAIHLRSDNWTLTISTSKRVFNPHLPMICTPHDSDISLNHVAMEQPMVISDRDRIGGGICCSIPSTLSSFLNRSPHSTFGGRRWAIWMDYGACNLMLASCLIRLLCWFALRTDG